MVLSSTARANAARWMWPRRISRRGAALAKTRGKPVIKLTRLNQHIVAINPDHISWVDVSPDTTLCLIAGEKIIVRETLDELIERVVEYRRAVLSADPGAWPPGRPTGDPPSDAVTKSSRARLGADGEPRRVSDLGSIVPSRRG
jgi:flagellar protein FlbD